MKPDATESVSYAAAGIGAALTVVFSLNSAPAGSSGLSASAILMLIWAASPYLFIGVLTGFFDDRRAMVLFSAGSVVSTLSAAAMYYCLLQGRLDREGAFASEYIPIYQLVFLSLLVAVAKSLKPARRRHH